MLIKMFVQPGETATGEIIFNTAQLAAAAAQQRKIAPNHLQGIHRQANMTELAGDIAMSGNRFTVQHQAAAHAGAEDQSHHQRVLRKLIVPRFRQRETVGVIIETHIAPQPRAEVSAQRPAAGGWHVSGIQRAVRRFRHSRNTDPDRTLLVEALIGLADQRLYRLEKILITTFRRSDAFFPLQSPLLIKYAQRYLAAANVKSIIHFSNSSCVVSQADDDDKLLATQHPRRVDAAGAAGGIPAGQQTQQQCCHQHIKDVQPVQF